MNRELTNHRIDTVTDTDLNSQVRILAIGKGGAGGAPNLYELFSGMYRCALQFQTAPIKDSGANGVSNKALLAIVLDRLECFQAGPYACSQNKTAIISIQHALEFLKERTRDRQVRGVEGEYKP